jgi:2-dehydro-3-deoxygluconokinase
LPLTDAYFPNDTEIMSVTKQKNVKKSLETVSSWGAQLTVVKLGAQGYIISNKGNFERGEAYKVKPVSTVGAGDVFNAAFISNFVKGEELAKCGVFANATAAFRVSMNRQATLSEVKEFINSHK